MSNALNRELEYMINRLSHRVLGHHPQYQPSTIISPLAKALELIMGSRVETSSDNNNALR